MHCEFVLSHIPYLTSFYLNFIIFDVSSFLQLLNFIFIKSNHTNVSMHI